MQEPVSRRDINLSLLPKSHEEMALSIFATADSAGLEILIPKGLHSYVEGGSVRFSLNYWLLSRVQEATGKKEVLQF